MKKSAFAVRSDIRNVVLCSLLAFGLAACGAGEGSSSSGTASVASDSTPTLVSPSIGYIDRSSETAAPSAGATTGTNVVANTTQSAAPVSGTTPTSSSTTASATTPATGAVPPPGTNSSTPAKSNNPSTGTVTLDWMPPT